MMPLRSSKNAAQLRSVWYLEMGSGKGAAMIEIQCTSCHTRYRIDERVLPEEAPTFKCSRCGHVFSADPGAFKGAGRAAAPSQTSKPKPDARKSESPVAEKPEPAPSKAETPAPEIAK